jgi:endonuclease/exonuclease/phosphatase family metal-dependent hydrolase
MLLRLVTYNIHSCIGADGKYDPDRIVEVLKELSADVIALQEVDSREHRGLEMLAHLSEETGLLAVPGPTLIKHTGSYGNALLTRLHIRQIRRHDLRFLNHEPRGAIDVDLMCGALLLQVMVTHLGLKPAERRFQVQYLLQRLSCPHCALLGDFNEWFLWGRPLRWLKATFGPAATPRTFPSSFPFFALDRIWVRPGEMLVGLEVHKSPLARTASDHLPVKAVIEF